MTTKALSGFTVLDLSSSIAPAYSTMLMADLGANVIKVEDPQCGDALRCFGPEVKGTYPVFSAYNRNKKSITLNLDKVEDLNKLYLLLQEADVLVDDFAPEKLQHYKLDYGHLKERNPKLITLSYSAFGNDAEYAHRPAFEETLQAESGFTYSIMDNTKGTPYNINYPVVDVTAGLYGIIAVEAAFHQRHTSGQGQKIDINRSYIGSNMLHFNILDNLFFGTTNPADQGWGAPIGFVKSKDGIVRVNSDEDIMYKRTLTVIDDPIMHDPKFLDADVRTENADLLMERMEHWTLQHTNKEIQELFADAGIPVGFVRTIEDLAADEHLKAREQIIELEVPDIGKVPYFAAPFKLNDTEIEYTAAPKLGEHNTEVLEDMCAKGGKL